MIKKSDHIFFAKESSCVFRLVVSSLLFVYAISFFAAENGHIRVSKILQASPSNVLSTEKLPRVYSKLIIDAKCELGGNRLLLPSGAELVIEGKGYIDNGVIKGDSSLLTVTSKKNVIGLNVLISGTWYNTEVYDSWFDFNHSPDFVSNRIIENILSLTDDSHFCHIYFQADRCYFLSCYTRVKQILVINCLIR